MWYVDLCLNSKYSKQLKNRLERTAFVWLNNYFTNLIAAIATCESFKISDFYV